MRSSKHLPPQSPLISSTYFWPKPVIQRGPREGQRVAVATDRQGGRRGLLVQLLDLAVLDRDREDRRAGILLGREKHRVAIDGPGESIHGAVELGRRAVRHALEGSA